MAKTARRSVASNPSSLTSSLLSNSSANIKLEHPQKLSSNSSVYAVDSLRSANFQPGTHNASNYRKASTQPFSSNGNNNSKQFENGDTNTTYSKEYNATLEAELRAADRERIRMEFYATYDVMTGVRIAATLGGFFGLMVFLIVYKSRSHSNETLKVLKDPKIAAVAAACIQEEEEREIQQAIEATGLSIFPEEYDNILFRRQRMLSLGNVSAPPVLNRGFRFSSVGGGGYCSLLEPPRRYSYSGSRRKSASESSRVLSAYPMGSSFGTDDYFIETDDELENEFDNLSTRGESTRQHSFLEVPPGGHESRRSSGMTCCSTESSYLERRCSAITLGLTALPSNLNTRLPTSSSRRSSTADMWDYYYPDIQVIQPTPKTSPCPSERSIHGQHKPTKMKSIDTTYYNHPNSKNQHKMGSYAYHNDPDSINDYHSYNLDKRSYSISEETNDENKISLDHPNYCSQYADDNELSSFVKRKMYGPSSTNNNNHIYNNNSCNNSSTQNNHSKDDVKRAPLASISSFKISSIDYQDSDLKSLGSDSVFVESYADTDDDMEQFSTDSDEISASLCTDHDKPTHPIQQDSIVSTENQKRTAHQMRNSSKKSGDKHHHHHPIISDLSKSTSNLGSRNRPYLSRHRSISVSSNDRTMLLAQQQSQDNTNVDDESGHVGEEDETPYGPSSYPIVLRSVPRILQHQAVSTETRSLPTDETTTATSSPLNTEIQKQEKSSFSYDNNSYSNNSSNSSRNNSKQQNKSKSKNINNSNSDCVEVNVVVENRPTNISPSVILELPVITLPSQATDPPRDPSLPGTSRKWSKETLF